MSGLTRTQEHALAVIHSYGGDRSHLGLEPRFSAMRTASLFLQRTHRARARRAGASGEDQ